MIAVGYFDGRLRAGLLVWTEREGESPSAIGGFDPGLEPPGNDCTTVVTTDRSVRLLRGWVHPDQIAEVSGQDGPEVEAVREDGKVTAG